MRVNGRKGFCCTDFWKLVFCGHEFDLCASGGNNIHVNRRYECAPSSIDENE